MLGLEFVPLYLIVFSCVRFEFTILVYNRNTNTLAPQMYRKPLNKQCEDIAVSVVKLTLLKVMQTFITLPISLHLVVERKAGRRPVNIDSSRGMHLNTHMLVSWHVSNWRVFNHYLRSSGGLTFVVERLKFLTNRNSRSIYV